MANIALCTILFFLRRPHLLFQLSQFRERFLILLLDLLAVFLKILELLQQILLTFANLPTITGDSRVMS